VTVNFGFHKRSSVLGTKGGGIHSESQVFDEEIIARRTKPLGYAIEARKEKYPNEEPYEYQPFIESNENFIWNNEARKTLVDYNLEDLSI
jgi:hypothetical protein